MVEQDERLKLQQQMFNIENNAKNFLEKDALLRYGNIRSVNPQRAFQIALIINQLAQEGKIDETINDTKFKSILVSLENQKKEFHINRR